MYKMKRRGPKCEPWGTPALKTIIRDLTNEIIRTASIHIMYKTFVHITNNREDLAKASWK